uniref:DoxX family protein n=1 Tax=Neobodo designis TaxID=312471 RepID=A0A7S1MGE7_NEODS
MFKFLGLVLLCGIFIASGYNKVTEPAQAAGLIRKSAFPKYLKLAGDAAGVKIPFGEKESVLFTQAIGGAFLLFAAQVIIGICRGCAAFCLALMVAAITAFMHLNLENPAATEMDQMIHVLKNASIIGGLLYVAATSCCGASACAPKASAEQLKKKKQ